jgi:hypothetical protein
MTNTTPPSLVAVRGSRHGLHALAPSPGGGWAGDKWLGTQKRVSGLGGGSRSITFQWSNVYVSTVYCMLAIALARDSGMGPMATRRVDRNFQSRQESGSRIINTVPQAEGHTISAPQEPQNPVSHCTDVMEPNTIGATGDPVSDSSRRLLWRWVTIRAGQPPM